MLFLRTGYSITKESANNSTVRGMKYDIVLGKDFDPKWAGFVGYHYTKNNTHNSMFDYGVDDYSKKLDAGLSYRMDDLNRFVVGIKYDVDSERIKDVDYYWYRDLHCSQVIMRYRAKRNKFEVRWQFTPW
jgi:LPS-assembly protein